jgi:two-component system, chemotaxis family, chemotaxis protein CheY
MTIASRGTRYTSIDDGVLIGVVAQRVPQESGPAQGPPSAEQVGAVVDWTSRPARALHAERGQNVATIGTTAGGSGLEHSEADTYLRRRVLLVDDDASIRMICSLNLQAAGFAVTEAADGLQGFEQATRDPPDLILSDLRMPGLDGFALAEALRRDEATRTVPVIFLSGESGVAERMRAYAMGVAGFVTKPFDPVALVSLLSRVIERTAAV